MESRGTLLAPTARMAQVLNFTMPVNTAEIAALARQYGFAGPSVEKTIRLLELLNAINQHEGLRKCLVLRGGTALHLFCMNMQRLSVDIDLIYTGSANKSCINEMQSSLRNVLKQQGVGVYHSVPFPESNPELWQVVYNSQSPEALGLVDNLVIDIDMRPKPLIHATEIRTSLPLGQHQAQDIRTVHSYEVASGKLTALMYRRKVRDLYDVSAMKRSEQWDRTQLQRTFLESNARQGKDIRGAAPLGLTWNPQSLRMHLMPLLKVGSCEDTDASLAEFGAQMEQDAEMLLNDMRALTPEQHAWLDALLDHVEVDSVAL